MSARRCNTMQKRTAYSPPTPSMSLTRNSRQSKFTFFEYGLVWMFLFLISQPQQTKAHIMIYSRLTSQLIEEYNDLPAQFGPSLPGNGFRLYVIPAEPNNGCDVMAPPGNLTDITAYPETARFAAIIQRGGKNCTFEMKVRNAQAANYSAAIVYNNKGDDLEQMSAQNSTGIRIPSVFVGHTTGTNLQTFFTPEIIIVINDELPFNINTQLILPFSILIGICFLIMIFYMIYKCIREERRLRRYRLPKSMLKKLPILKYTKNSDLNYDTCVICLDEFVEGDKLRVLPCRHPYHSHCIDPWLTENRRVCPVCKRKVFTKGEARSSRNRQSSLDSLTDTDDDTTPLLQQRGANATTRRSRGTSTNAPGTNATALAETTRHGTFLRVGNATEATVSDSNSQAENTSDDENLLLAHQSPAHNAHRVNPFDRAPNLPPHLAEQLSENRHSIWSLPIFSFFRRPESISVAAPPYLEEVIHDDTSMLAVQGNRSASLPLATTQTPTHSSNNILNPNLSGSFKDESDQDNDDDDINAEQPHRSIYEPINNDNNSSNNTNTTTTNINNTTATTTTTTTALSDNRNITDTEAEALALFVQTPTIGGIGVAALPNPNIHDISVGTRPATNHRGRRHFLI